jgi:hypothetical protein
MFSKFGYLLGPHQGAIQPQLLAPIQCVRRWRKAGLGDDNVAISGAVTDDKIDILYGVSSWCDGNDK